MGALSERLGAKDAEAAAAAEKAAGLVAAVVGLEAECSELRAERGRLEEQLEAVRPAARDFQCQMAEVESSFNKFKRNSEIDKQGMEEKLQETLRKLEVL